MGATLEVCLEETRIFIHRGRGAATTIGRSAGIDQVVIGRGGKSYWVDVRLDAPADVSREHCRIRRDAASGRFYIRDASQFGTFIDGIRIPSSVGSEAGAEQPLPSRCSIGLAGVLTIDLP